LRFGRLAGAGEDELGGGVEIGGELDPLDRVGLGSEDPAGQRDPPKDAVRLLCF
jgi:hypothetical protein